MSTSTCVWSNDNPIDKNGIDVTATVSPKFIVVFGPTCGVFCAAFGILNLRQEASGHTITEVLSQHP
jgi:hypothetical protein